MYGSWDITVTERLMDERRSDISGFYPSLFAYSCFFPKIEFFYCFHENAFPTDFLALTYTLSTPRSALLVGDTSFFL